MPFLIRTCFFGSCERYATSSSAPSAVGADRIIGFQKMYRYSLSHKLFLENPAGVPGISKVGRKYSGWIQATRSLVHLTAMLASFYRARLGCFVDSSFLLRQLEGLRVDWTSIVLHVHCGFKN